MKPSIAAKLFVALFGIAVMMVVLVIARTVGSLHTGFSDYLNTGAVARMGELAGRLEQNYALTNDWSGIASPPVWAEIVRESVADERARRLNSAVPWEHEPHDAPFGAFAALMEHLALADRSGAIVAGARDPMPNPARRDLELNGAVIGALLFDAGPVPGGIDAAFLADRTRDLYLTGIAAVLISGVAAILIARNILGPIRDVTGAARRLASGDFAARIDTRRRDELGDLVRDFNGLAQALQTAEAARRQWVADTSHELRTPLAVLRAQIEAFQDGVHPVTPRGLDGLHAEVQRLTQLVGDLHELSRADTGALSLRMEPVQPGALLAEMLAGFAPRLQARSLNVQADRLVGHGRAMADPDRLRQVFANILENVVRYTAPGGHVRAAEHADADVLRIVVEDSAPGVALSDQPRLFDRFFRADASRNRGTGGSGLGLAICRAIVEAHAGTITAATSPLGGLAVTVALPVLRA